MHQNFQDGRHFQNGRRRKFKKMKKILEPSNLVSKRIDYHSGVFYPTGIREGIYCDLLAITTLNLVIILLIFPLLLTRNIVRNRVIRPFLRSKWNFETTCGLTIPKKLLKQNSKNGRRFQNGRHSRWRKKLKFIGSSWNWVIWVKIKSEIKIFFRLPVFPEMADKIAKYFVRSLTGRRLNWP